jgi:hypothetical protein
MDGAAPKITAAMANRVIAERWMRRTTGIDDISKKAFVPVHASWHADNAATSSHN